MKNQIVAAFKKKQIAAAFIVGGAIIIAPAIVIIALLRLGHERGRRLSAFGQERISDRCSVLSTGKRVSNFNPLLGITLT
jgi:hypothetical protein